MFNWSHLRVFVRVEGHMQSKSSLVEAWVEALHGACCVPHFEHLRSWSRKHHWNDQLKPPARSRKTWKFGMDWLRYRIRMQPYAAIQISSHDLNEQMPASSYFILISPRYTPSYSFYCSWLLVNSIMMQVTSCTATIKPLTHWASLSRWQVVHLAEQGSLCWWQMRGQLDWWPDRKRGSVSSVCCKTPNLKSSAKNLVDLTAQQDCLEEK